VRFSEDPRKARILRRWESQMTDAWKSIAYEKCLFGGGVSIDAHPSRALEYSVVIFGWLVHMGTSRAEINDKSSC
jgi:hypothetical protein